MAKFADFERYVLPWISNVPIPAMHDALRDAAIEFCERTRVVTRMMTGLPIVAGEPDIPLDLVDCDMEVCEPLEVWLVESGVPIGKPRPKTTKELDDRFPEGWRDEVRDSLRLIPFWISLTKCSVRLVPQLSVSLNSAVSVLAAMKPTNDAKALPDLLFRHYGQDIGHGALALLHSHKEVGYADSKRVQPHRTAFELAMTKANDHYAHGFNKPQLRSGRDEFT